MGVFIFFFAQKSDFGFWGVNFFVINLDHFLGLNYAEILSSIGLMVEAVDTFWCSAGACAGAVPGVIIQKTSAKSDLASWLGWGCAGVRLGWAELGLGFG